METNLTSKPENVYERHAIVDVSSIDEPEMFAMRNIKETDVAELAGNIGAMGRLENELLVRSSRSKPGRYELVCGHRRLKAVKQLKWAKVPVKIRVLTDIEAFEDAISENIGRADPSPLEEAKAYKSARDTYKMNLDAIALKVGKDKSTISNRIRLLDMDKDVIKALDDGKITAGHCEHGFMRLKHPQDQKKLLETVKEQEEYDEPVTVKEIENLARCQAMEREKIEELAGYMQRNKDKILTPKCPRCGKDPTPDNCDLKKNILMCSSHNYDHRWNPMKTKAENLPKPEKQAGTAPQKSKDEDTIGSEAQNLTSSYSASEFCKVISDWLVGKDAITHIGINQYGNSISLEIEAKQIKGFPLPDLSVESAAKGKPHQSEIQFDVYSDQDIADGRDLVWMLEKKMGKKPQAQIVREPVDKIKLAHTPLMKGTQLEVEKGDKAGKWTVQTLHEDLTAIVMDPKKKPVFLEEKELRALVKAAKK